MGVSCRSRSADETRAIAEAVASVFLPGDVVSLSGELGAGKTCFVQGAARALGVSERVTSPTFIIMREYQGDYAVLHIDAYRLETFGELADLGLEEFTDRVMFIEWGEAVSPAFPEHLEVALTVGSDDARVIEFRAHGSSFLSRMDDIAKRIGTWAC